MPNIFNTWPTRGQITEYLHKSLNKRIKRVFFILSYWKHCSLIISTFIKVLDYKNQENHCKGPLFTYASRSQGVEHGLFSGKYHLKVTIADLNWELRKNFNYGALQKLDAWIFQIWQILRLPNLLNAGPTRDEITYYL